MKVILFISILLSIVLGIRFTISELELWLAILLTAGAVLGFLVIMYIRGQFLAKKTWICPNCGERFKIDEWYHLGYVPLHLYTCRVRCTQCGKPGWCTWE